MRIHKDKSRYSQQVYTTVYGLGPSWRGPYTPSHFAQTSTAQLLILQPCLLLGSEIPRSGQATSFIGHTPYIPRGWDPIPRVLPIATNSLIEYTVYIQMQPFRPLFPAIEPNEAKRLPWER